MSNTVEGIIIRTALDHPGLLTRNELEFVRNIAKLPSEKRLTQGRLNWLYQIGRERLNLGYPTPQPDPVIDLKSRAYL
jgi:hypothetical protein